MAACVRLTRRAGVPREATVKIANATHARPSTPLEGPMRASSSLSSRVRPLRSPQHARAPRHSPRTGGDAERGARAAAPAVSDPTHALLRADAPGLMVLDDLRRRALLLG